MSLRPSRITTGNLTHLTSNQTVDQATSDVLLPTQDGGNSSDTRELSLSTKKERFLTSVETLTKRTETLRFTTRMVESTNNGILFMLTNGRVNQRKESSMKISDSTSKEISSLLLR
jgi:hypothetical protein